MSDFSEFLYQGPKKVSSALSQTIYVIIRKEIFLLYSDFLGWIWIGMLVREQEYFQVY